MPNYVVKYRGNRPMRLTPGYTSRSVRMLTAVAGTALRNQLRRAARNYIKRKGKQAMDWVYDRASSSRKRKANDQIIYRMKGRRVGDKSRYFYRLKGMAQGPTHTTTRMIVRKTPREQRSLRKYFRNVPLKNMFVNRFGFAWMGSTDASKAVWYSICHLKFNNLTKYMSRRYIQYNQQTGVPSDYDISQTAVGNSPDSLIYVGKCTFSYELYNPTNYIMTVFIYDLICKRDTPYTIAYNSVQNTGCQPEACMRTSTLTVTEDNKASAQASWVVADPTNEDAATGTAWNSIGMKPTDYHFFNTFWKVKGMRKIVLPPTSSHHHVVVYNPKKVLTQANLYYPHQKWAQDDKYGLGGMTQATLFGFQGQIAVENNTEVDNTGSIGTLPGKLIISCVKKVNIWNVSMRANNIISENTMKNTFSAPRIFTDLVEQTATSS